MSTAIKSNNIGKIALKILPFLQQDNLPGLVSNLASNAINEFERKISGKGAVRAGKVFTLFTSNEDLNDIIKITKALEDANTVIDCITETVKHFY